jgi:hypothetical protein
MDPRQ